MSPGLPHFFFKFIDFIFSMYLIECLGFSKKKTYQKYITCRVSYSIKCLLDVYIMHECWNLSETIWNFSSIKIKFKFAQCPSPASSNCAALPRLSGGKRKQSSAIRWTLKPQPQLPTETSGERMRTTLSRLNINEK